MEAQETPSGEIPPQDQVDEALVARIAAGDPLALGRLIDRHGRGLRLFAGRYLGRSDEAEDIVQDVFLSVWKHAGGFDPRKGKATTWLYRIAANRCIDVRRWRRLRVFVGLEGMDERLPSGDPEADILVGARQELTLVRAGLDALPERQRMAILLRAVADLDVPAIAEVMKTSPGAVEQLLVRARRSLRAGISGTRAPQGGNERKWI
ncbi:sigma-70 family RNA polymerase sigma factor [Gellertiella hungarica]|uniref:RNA polymerase sigma factor n=1 Tax=Gellertiella hungarica TaxID=1572859 RepID=A0A7W6J613_9HYPH|nr:RNA polymerase sigma-70 factor (ECF subfamily) [Gellertiella hungarica]